jgi:predicted PurR-regulated permease PerM
MTDLDVRPVPSHEPPPAWPRAVALAAVTAVAVYACWLMFAPLLPGVVTGAATVALALPLHRWVRRHVPSDSLAAGLTLTAVLVGVFGPLAWVSAQLAVEARTGADVVERHVAGGRWREAIDDVPYLRDWVARVESQDINLEQEARAAVARIGQTTLGVVQGTGAVIFQLLIAVFVAFFGFRDHSHLLAAGRRLLPLDRADADRVIRRVDDAVVATVYGTVLTGLIQGVTGGLVFWLLGLPAPVLWGVVMAVLSVLPVLGAFLVWVPAAAWLGANGDVWQAAVLVGWGLLMAGPVCNSVYAVTAGGRMRLHPVPVLLAFVGGLAVFGLAGMVLGPAVLAFTVAVIDVWRGERPELAVPADSEA